MAFFTSVDRHFDKLYVRGYDDESYPFSYKTGGDDISCSLFIKDKNGTSKFKTIFGENTKEIHFNSFSEMNDFKRDFGKEFSILGDSPIENQYINQKKLSEKYDKSLINIGIFDIECESKFGFPSVEEAKEMITVISCLSTKTMILTCFALSSSKLEIEWKDETISLNLVFCSSEQELLRKFLSYWKKESFDIIGGWNTKLFDIPYLYYRIAKVLSQKEANSLSFWNLSNVKEKMINGRKQIVVDLFGNPHLDYIDLYKKFVLKPRDSYKLDSIAEIELGQNKLDYSEYQSIQEFWEKNPSKFILYNLIDVALVYRLEKKLGLFSLAMSFSFTAKQNFIDVFSPVKTWDSLCYNALFSKNIVVPELSPKGKNESFEGAYVKEVLPGKYNDVVSYDLNSLYPSIIQFLNISPETIQRRIIDKDIQNCNLVERILSGELDNLTIHKENNLTFSANGQFFSKNKKGFIPEIMFYLMSERKKAKSMMNEYEKELEQINQELSNL